MTIRHACVGCGRQQGSTKDRGGDEDGSPLGRVSRCQTCGRWACPDCDHEGDCCFAEADDHTDDPAWAPPGWRMVNHRPGIGTKYQRISP